MKNVSILWLVALLLFSCQSGHQKSSDDQKQALSEIIAVNKGDVDFNTWFLDKTMRLDYYHTGNAKEEIFAIDKVLSDSIWPGSKKILIDKLELGPYFFEVLDKESKILLYSRGFSSIFSEWQTTPDANVQWGTFHESLRFPWPLKPVVVVVKKRNAENKFKQVWSTDIDPSSRQVNPASKTHREKVDVILDNGPVCNKLDIVILGDGYSAEEMEKFRHDCSRLSEVLLSTEPFKSQRMSINIRAVETPALQPGVSKPHHGVFRRTPLSVSYSTFDSERYALTYDNKTIRDIA